MNEEIVLNLDPNESFTLTDLNRIKLVSSIQNLSALSVKISIFQSVITTLSLNRSRLPNWVDFQVS